MNQEFSDDEIDFSQDAAKPAIDQASPSGAAEALKRVSDMAVVLRAAEDRVLHAESELEAAEKAHTRISQVDFPDLLQELDMKEFVLKDGRKIVIDEDVQCGISEERAHAAFGWLRERGYGGLIRSSVHLEFAKGEEEQRAAVVNAIRALGRDPRMKDEVHWQTLKSFVKEQRGAMASAGGEAFPDELFGVHPITQALVGEGKKKPSKLKRAYQKKK